MTQEHINKLQELKKLVDAGILTQEEMQEEKKKILAVDNTVGNTSQKSKVLIRCSACGEEANIELAECPHCHERLSGKTMEVDNNTKPCMFCGEPILSIANKCKHCGKWQKEEEAKPVEPVVTPMQTKVDNQICCNSNIPQHKYKWYVLGALVGAAIILAIVFSGKSGDGKTYETLKGITLGANKETVVKQFHEKGILKNVKAEDIDEYAVTMEGFKFPELEDKVGWIELRFDNDILTTITFEFWDETEYEWNKNIKQIISSYLDSKYRKTGNTSYRYKSMSINVKEESDRIGIVYSINTTNN